jgi:hypothetical protein
MIDHYNVIDHKRTIQAKDIVTDIRNGLCDAELMEKYRLTANGLQSAFDQLIKKRIISVKELYGRPTDEDDTVIIDDSFQPPRHYLTVAVPIYDPERPEVKGKLRDITDRGLGVIGVESSVGETRSFVIPCRKFIKMENIWLEAECLWTDPATEDEQTVAGFQIIAISEENMTRLRRLITFLSFG